MSARYRLIINSSYYLTGRGDDKKIKKNILAIGIISLFIGMVVLPMCSASTPSTVLSASENDSDQEPLGVDSYFFIKAQVEGTVKNLHRESIFGAHAHGPIDLKVQPLRGGAIDITFPDGMSWSFSARYAKLEMVDQGNDIYYIKGTVYLCSIKSIE